jgi:hypothetical protein
MATTRIASAALYVGLATALLLLMPAVAMQFTAEVAWGAEDFLAAAALVFAAGLACVLGSRQARNFGQRVAVCFISLGAAALVWAELAVGLFR